MIKVIHQIECDTCGSVDYVPTDSKLIANRVFKENGWIYDRAKVGSDKHYCSQLCKDSMDNLLKIIK